MSDIFHLTPKRSAWRRTLVVLALLLTTMSVAAAPAYADAGKLSTYTCTGNYFMCIQAHVYEKGGQFRAELYRLNTSATGTVAVTMTLYQCSGNGRNCLPFIGRSDRVANGKNSSTAYKTGSFGHNYKACVLASPYFQQEVCTPQMSYTTA